MWQMLPQKLKFQAALECVGFQITPDQKVAISSEH